MGTKRKVICLFLSVAAFGMQAPGARSGELTPTLSSGRVVVYDPLHWDLTFMPTPEARVAQNKQNGVKFTSYKIIKPVVTKARALEWERESRRRYAQAHGGREPRHNNEARRGKPGAKTKRKLRLARKGVARVTGNRSATRIASRPKPRKTAAAGFSWTAAKEERLKRLYRDGDTCVRIASKMGLSQGQVAGRIKRLQDMGRLRRRWW